MHWKPIPNLGNTLEVLARMPMMAESLDVAITLDLTDFTGFGAMLSPRLFDWGGTPRQPQPASPTFQLFEFHDGYLRLGTSKVTTELQACLSTNTAFRGGAVSVRTFLLSPCSVSLFQRSQATQQPEHGTCAMNTMFSRTAANTLFSHRVRSEVWAAPSYAAWHIRVVSEGDLLQNYSPAVHTYIHASSPTTLCEAYLATLVGRISPTMKASVFLGSNSLAVREECINVAHTNSKISSGYPSSSSSSNNANSNNQARVRVLTNPTFGVSHLHSGDKALSPFSSSSSSFPSSFQGGGSGAGDKAGELAGMSLMGGMLSVLDFFAFVDANSITHSGASMVQFIVKSEGWSCTDLPGAIAKDSSNPNERAAVRVCYPPRSPPPSPPPPLLATGARSLHPKSSSSPSGSNSSALSGLPTATATATKAGRAKPRRAGLSRGIGHGTSD